MKFYVNRDTISIVPEEHQDVAFIEDTLGMNKDGLNMRLTRVRDHGNYKLCLQTTQLDELDVAVSRLRNASQDAQNAAVRVLTWLSNECNLEEMNRLCEAVTCFTEVMKSRLMDKAASGYSGWDDPDMATDISVRLEDCVEGLRHGREYEVDVANFAMMLYFLRVNKKYRVRSGPGWVKSKEREMTTNQAEAMLFSKEEAEVMADILAESNLISEVEECSS